MLVMVASSAVAQEQVTDSVGTRFRLLEGGRFIQGTSGGENVLKRSFPLSTTGQFYGNAEDPAHVTWITRPFHIAETEVTVGQFRIVPSSKKGVVKHQLNAAILRWSDGNRLPKISHFISRTIFFVTKSSAGRILGLRRVTAIRWLALAGPMLKLIVIG